MLLTDILIHINDSLNTQQRGHIEADLRAIEGVIAPRFHAKRIHLLTILYNADRVQATDLLNSVMAKGYKAQWIAM